MDESVLAAIARWPDVPAVFGWLSLTARGEWRIRGEPIGNPAIREFIGRNYAADAQGRWFFQNGPQRVYVALELAPWVYRVQGDDRLQTHTGRVPHELIAAALLDDGRLALATELGAGNVDDRDASRLLQALTGRTGTPLTDDALEGWLADTGDACLPGAALGLRGGALLVSRMRAGDLGARFGFQPEPAPG